MTMPKPIEISAATCVANVGAVLGEGPLWDAREGVLYWLDIKGGKRFRYHPQTKSVVTYAIDGMFSAMAPRRNGGFIAAARDGFFRLSIENGNVLSQPIINPEIDLPRNRFNDGKADPAGGFWAGTMDDNEEKASGAWWRLSPKGEAVKLIDDFMVTNGPAFDRGRGRVFLTDSAKRIIYVADTDGASLGALSTFLQFGKDDGYPDGMEVDCEGCLWVAFWDGSCVRRFSGSGQKIAEIALPIPRPTSLAIAKAGLYVTSARIGLSAEELRAAPQSGGLFYIPIDHDLSNAPQSKYHG